MSAANPAKAPPGPPGGVALTPAGLAATGAAWRRGGAQAAEDARRAVRPDVATPFASFEDAVTRLLPYHVYGTEEGDEADVDEAAAAGGVLLASRVQQWDDMCLRKAAEFSGTLKRQAEAYEADASKRRSEAGRLRPEEGYLVARLAAEEQRARHAAGRAATQARAAATGLGPAAGGTPQAQPQGQQQQQPHQPPPQQAQQQAQQQQAWAAAAAAAAGAEAARQFAQPLGAPRPPAPPGR